MSKSGAGLMRFIRAGDVIVHGLVKTFGLSIVIVHLMVFASSI